MNGILRNRLSSCSTLRHARVVLYSSTTPSPPPSTNHTSQSPSSATQTPAQIPNNPSTSDPQSLPLPNGALTLPHGLTIRKKPSTLVTYRNLKADELLDVIYHRKKAGEPQELLNFIYLMMEYRKTNNTQGIMDIIVLMKEVGVEPNLHIYNMLITHFGLMKDPHTVKEVLVKMRDKGYDLSDSNYTAPILAFLNSENGKYYQDGVDTFHWAARKGVALKPGTYFTLISHAVAKGDDATCQQVLAEMAKHGLEPPDSKDIFDMHIAARAQNRDYKGVLQKYAEIRSLGLFPSYPSYTYVFRSGSALRESAHIHNAWKDLRSTMGPAPLIATSISQYTAYVRALALASDTQGCFEALSQLRADGLKPIARTYVPVMEALLRRGDAAGLTRLLSEAEADGFTFTGSLLEAAKKVIGGDKLDEIRKQGKQPTANAYNTQLNKLMKDGDHQGLMRTAEDMLRDGIAYDVTTYHTLLSHAASKESIEEVRRLHAKMVADGVRPDAHIYNLLAQSYARVNDAAACAQLVDAMLREGIPLHTQAFQPTLSVFMEGNDVDRCYAMLARMRSPTQDALDVPTYGRIIDLMLSKGDILGCNRILAEMQAKGVKPSLAIYNSLIGFAAHKGDSRWVSVLMDEVSTQGLRADMTTYTRLLEGLALNGDAEACDIWVASMRTHGLSPSRAMYHNIISAKAMRGDAEACGRIVREMGIRGMSPEPQAYAVTLHLLVRKGDQLNCRAVYEDMKGKGVVPDRSTYNSVALISGTEDGLRLLNDMRENAVMPDAETYRALLGSMAWRGDVDGCRRALAEMDRDGVVPDVATYNSLVANLGRHVDSRMLCNRLLEAITPAGFMPFVNNPNQPEFNSVPMYAVPNSNPITPLPLPNISPIISPVTSITPPSNVTTTQDNKSTLLNTNSTSQPNIHANIQKSNLKPNPNRVNNKTNTNNQPTNSNTKTNTANEHRNNNVRNITSTNKKTVPNTTTINNVVRPTTNTNNHATANTSATNLKNTRPNSPPHPNNSQPTTPNFPRNRNNVRPNTNNTINSTSNNATRAPSPTPNTNSRPPSPTNSNARSPFSTANTTARPPSPTPRNNTNKMPQNPPKTISNSITSTIPTRSEAPVISNPTVSHSSDTVTNLSSTPLNTTPTPTAIPPPPFPPPMTSLHEQESISPITTTLSPFAHAKPLPSSPIPPSSPKSSKTTSLSTSQLTTG